MSHIFGIAHSFGGIVEQIGNIFGISNPQQTPLPQSQYGPMFAGNAFSSPPPRGPIDETFGESAGMEDFDYGALGNRPAGCGPCTTRKTVRYVTTVCPDGSSYTREQKSRKRKRRLASMSDIKDLAALKSILGGGKAFESWIATRRS